VSEGRQILDDGGKILEFGTELPWVVVDLRRTSCWLISSCHDVSREVFLSIESSVELLG
jgi:hypothetical protein